MAAAAGAAAARAGGPGPAVTEAIPRRGARRNGPPAILAE